MYAFLGFTCMCFYFRVSPSVVEQLLLYVYGGVVDLMESCAVEEFIMTADMYGLEGIKTVVVSYLKRDYCHMFHKVSTSVLYLSVFNRYSSKYFIHKLQLP